MIPRKDILWIKHSVVSYVVKIRKKHIIHKTLLFKPDCRTPIFKGILNSTFINQKPTIFFRPVIFCYFQHIVLFFCVCNAPFLLVPELLI